MDVPRISRRRGRGAFRTIGRSQ